MMKVLIPYFFMLALVGLVALPGWVGWSWFESSAYERMTGIDVSLLDAMFLELRVDGCERPPGGG